MAVYRNDADLHLLGQCSNEELQLLISILTTDPRDGDTRWTESLTSSPEYRLLAPDHRRYWQLIAAELQRYGANTLMSMARFGQGVVYREILEDVCKKLDVNYNTKSATETIELALLMKVLEKSLAQMTQEELSAFSRTMQLDLTNPTPQLIIMAVQAAIRTSSLAALELATVMSAGIITSLGGIATGHCGRGVKGSVCHCRSRCHCTQFSMDDFRHYRSGLPGNHTRMHDRGLAPSATYFR